MKFVSYFLFFILTACSINKLNESEQNDKEILREELDDEGLESEVLEIRSNARKHLDYNKIIALGLKETYLPEEPLGICFLYGSPNDENIVEYSFIDNHELDYTFELGNSEIKELNTNQKIYKYTTEKILMGVKINAILKLNTTPEGYIKITVLTNEKLTPEEIIEKYDLTK